MLPPLKDTTADGKVLTRRKLTSQQIEEFFETGTGALVEKATSNNRSSPEYVRSETLLFFMRESKNRNNQDLFNTIYAILYSRVEMIALKGLTMRSFSQEWKRDAVLDKFNELIAVDRDGYAHQLDYMECSFDQVVANWRKDASRSLNRKRKREESLPEEDDPDGANPATIRAIGDLSLKEMSPEELATFRLQVLPAINSLPEQQKRVMIMSAKGYNDGSNDPNETTISSVLGCDRKTVYNLRKRALETIRERYGIKLS